MMATHKRRLAAKGRWMKLTSGANLQAHMTLRRLNQSELADYVGCSRQFINKLLKGTSTGCTPKLARDIEKVLNVPEGAIFVPKQATEIVQTVKSKQRLVTA